MADIDSIRSVSSAFVDARRQDKMIATFPGDLPRDLDTAYRIQDDAIALAGGMVGGWKLGRVPDGLVAQYGARRLGGPIFEHQIVTANGAMVEMPVLKGFAAVEAELLLQIGMVPDGPLTLESARDHVSKICLGIEIASSPFSGINDHGPAVTVSDFGNNFGLVVGPEITDWRELDLFNAPACLEIDGQPIGEGKLATMLDGPFGSLVFLNDLLQARGRSVKVGDWVSTGAMTGVHQTKAGHVAKASFDERYSVSCRTIPYAAFGEEGYRS
jgi:2-keto-4-pentenoate hydratase